jgi:hypothetical protein
VRIVPYVVGPRSRKVTGRQGTAARSFKRTVGSGDARGRPAENAKMHKGWVKRLRRPRPSSTMRRKPPKSPDTQPHCNALPGRQRSRPSARPVCAGAPTEAHRADRATESKRRNPPAPLPGHRRCPDVGADGEGPRGSVPRGPSHARVLSRGPLPCHVTLFALTCDPGHIRIL